MKNSQGVRIEIQSWEFTDCVQSDPIRDYNSERKREVGTERILLDLVELDICTHITFYLVTILDVILARSLINIAIGFMTCSC